MFHVHHRWLSLCLALFLIGGCAGHGVGAPAPSYPDVLESSAKQGNILVRGFLSTLPRQSAGEFAYYSYLLFDSRSKEWTAAHRAAVRSFLALFDDVDRIDPTLLEGANLMVLYLPVVHSAPLETPSPRDEAAVDLLLSDYNWTLAQLIRQSVEQGTRLPLPPVAIVGYTSSIDPRNTKVDPDHLWIIDLTYSDETVIDKRMTMFKEGCERAPRTQSTSVRLEYIRNLFLRVGALIP